MGLGSTDWRLVGLVALELLVVRLSLFSLGHRTTARILTALTPSRRVASSDPETVAGTVETVAARLPVKTTCLSEALVCKTLLDESGFETDLRVGVAKAGRDLEAHAWLVHRGEVIVGGGVEDLGRFDTMAESFEP